jgi:hypothetical protein
LGLTPRIAGVSPELERLWARGDCSPIPSSSRSSANALGHSAASWCRPSCNETRRAGLLCDFSVGETHYDRNSYPGFNGDGMSKLTGSVAPIDHGAYGHVRGHHKVDNLHIKVNCAITNPLLACVACRVGRAFPRMALRLFHFAIGCYFSRAYEDAVAAANNAIQAVPEWPLSYRFRAAALGSSAGPKKRR